MALSFAINKQGFAQSYMFIHSLEAKVVARLSKFVNFSQICGFETCLVEVVSS